MNDSDASAKPVVPKDKENAEAALAFRFVNETNQHIFLTGRAGTGKTTFLRRVVRDCIKQLAVVAPTGVAAINAQGVTIHSLFQLPFGLLLPSELHRTLGQRKLNREKQQVLKSLGLLIIDEISMVRADVLDAIDWTLRRYRDPSKAFGGVQLLMIGDLHQLPPVVTDSEAPELRAVYQTPYFFSSQALATAGVKTIELKKIYRQRDEQFVTLLNEVRANRMTTEVLSQLNQRYVAPTSDKHDGVITLTSHRKSSNQLNTHELAKLTGKAKVFKAKIEGNFPAHTYPTVESLTLKVGAQVMFVKNEPPPERRYFNGKLGIVTAIEDKEVTIKCHDDGQLISVSPISWEHKKYKVDGGSKTKDLTEEVVGTFTQLPLRLAWAITIHKSQGLTFDKVNIDANAAFAHGQVYVALSRCRTLEGIRLLSKIGSEAVRTDQQVRNFSEEQQHELVGEEQLSEARASYHKSLVQQAFDLTAIERSVNALLRYYIENESSYVQSSLPQFEQLTKSAEEGLFRHAKAFRPVLIELQSNLDYSEALIPVSERTVRAAKYFDEHLEKLLIKPLSSISFSSENKQTEQRTQTLKAELGKAIRISKASLNHCQSPFTPQAFIRSRVAQDLAKEKYTKARKRASIPEEAPVTQHPALYQLLYQWRKARADAEGFTTARKVLPVKVLIELSNELPISERGLKAVPGMGAKRRDSYGEEVLAIVQEFCEKENLEGDQKLAEIKTKGAPLPKLTDTRRASYELYKAGSTIQEIADERNLKPNTIASHLYAYVRHGQLPLHDFVKQEEVAEIMKGIEVLELGILDSTNPLYEHFGGKYDYSILRLVLDESHRLENKADS